MRGRIRLEHVVQKNMNSAQIAENALPLLYVCRYSLLRLSAIAMKIECDFHMVEGDGETSYAKNSRLQEKSMLEAKPVLEAAINEVYAALLPETMVVADLGCSSGPATLLFVSEVIGMVTNQREKLGHGRHRPVELQFFLNDLPRNDFNHVFRSLEQLKGLVAVAADHRQKPAPPPPPPHYVAGVPGSYYTRLFPRRSVHLFHSSYCLTWRSQVPEGLEGKRWNADRNQGNGADIYITKATPLPVVKLYQEQFYKDLSLFLELRHQELVLGGQMVLVFPGRKDEDVYNGELNHLHGLLAQSLQYLVHEGLVEMDRLASFNLPVYGPSVEEVKRVVEETGLFDIGHMRMLEPNWDPHDDSDEGDAVRDPVRSGANTARMMRAVMEPLIASHFGFGEPVLDVLFEMYARNIARHLAGEKAKLAVIVMSLSGRGEE